MNNKILRPRLAALAMLFAAPHAAADGAELYGILDAGIARVEHSLNFDPNHPVMIIPYASAPADKPVIGMFNGGLSQTRWGIRGSEDVGNGMKASFTLEGAINVPDGAISNAAASMALNGPKGPNMSADSAISGQLFSRSAWVALESGQMGKLSLGRHQSFFLENIGQFDPMRGSQIFSPIGFSGTYSGGGNTEDSRVDNSVRWDKTFGEVRVGALYKFGGVAGMSSAQSAAELNVTYEHGPLGLVAGVERFKDAFASSNGAAIGTLSVTANNTLGYMLGLRYAIADTLTLRMGYEREEFTNPSNPAADAIASIFGFPISGAVNVNAFAHQKNIDVFWGGLNYDVSPALTLTAAGYYVKQNDFSGTGCTAASAKCSGTSKYFSLLADYKLSKKTDIYAGFMQNNVSGGLGFGFINTNDNIVGTGLRIRF